MGLLLACAALLRPGEVRAQSAFSCDGSFYQIRQVGNTSQIFRVDRSKAAYTTVPLLVTNNSTSNDLGVLVNGLAYNSQDGYMYALTTPGAAGSNTNTPVTLYKIGQNSITQVGGAITVGGANLAITVASGTFDKSGNYYFSSQNTGGTADYSIYRIAPGSSTPTAATRLAPSQNVTMYDIAFNPSDGLIYGVNFVGSLYQFNTTNNVLTVITNPPNANQTASMAVGTAAFDVAGNLYAYSNGTVQNGTTAAVSGNFYQVSTSTGAYTLISAIDPASVSDGASCINPGNAIDVTKDLVNVKPVANAAAYDVTYSVQVRNTYTATDAYVQVSDLLKGNTTTTTNVTFPTAQSVSIISAPVVTNYDGATLVANSAYTGLSATPNGSAVGGGSLLDGMQPLTAGQRAVITYTVRVTFANAGSVPTTAQNNTAYATSTAVAPNQGYTLLSNDALLTPNDLVANDASTNSADFATLRNGASNGTPAANDTPSPTPVTFAPSISGTVFEDVNYGGGAGRGQVASQGIGRPGARVELYNSVAGVATYSTFTTTAADGSYSFTGLTAGNSYTVRVVSSSVTSSRNTGNATGLVGVQTFRTSTDATNGTVPDPNRVGGEYPARVEAGNGSTASTIASLLSTTAAAESISTVMLAGNTSNAPAVGVDFGYNFDTVVNTNDTGQGSLRQFITNANALDNTNLAQAPASTGGATPAVGVETSIFMITDGNAHDGLAAYSATSNPGLKSQLAGASTTTGTGGTVAVFTPGTALPALGGTYGASTSIDGTTQAQNVGNTNPATLGTSGTVGTAGTALAKVNGPEVQIQGTNAVATGLSVATSGTNATIKGLSIYGFGNGTDSDTYGNIRVAAAGVQILSNVIGTAASSFTAPSTTTNADGIRLVPGTSNTTISNNLIGFNQGKGIAVDGGVTGVTITGNEVDNNAQSNSTYGAIDIQGSGATVSGNLLLNNAGTGLDSYTSSGSNTFSGNTLTGNGGGTTANAPSVTAGVRVYGSGNTVSQNVISNSYGDGIMLASSATTTKLSQNSIFNNGNVAAANGATASGAIGIDLLTTNDGNAGAGGTPFVTLNSSATNGANALVNFPVITSTAVVGTNLLVQGYAKAGATLEFFLAQANPTTPNATGANFGQGKTYLNTALEGNTDSSKGPVDTNGNTGVSYSGNINSFSQGSDTNANGFSFLIPLTAAQQAAVKGGTLLTSTATLNNATSEFSGNAVVQVGDVTVSLNGPTTLYAGQPTGTYTAVFTNEGPTTATNVARVLTLPAGASLTTAQQNDLITRYGLTASSFTTTGSGNTAVTTINFGTLATLANNATSTVTFAFTAPATISSTLTLTANTTADAQAANTAPDQASLTLNTVGNADVTAAITASNTATTGTFMAMFGNAGPQAAAGVVPTVQLPAGLTGVTIPTSGWSYSSTTGLVTYSSAPATFAANTTSALSVTINYPLSSAPTAPVTAVASVSTTTDEAGKTANNVAQAMMANLFDLTTTLTGPTAAITGSPTTLYVTTTNNGPNLAPNATQTVSIPSAATLAGNIFLTNGGTYSYSGGVGTVTFPALSNVPSGQTVTNSITFLAPTAPFAPSATVSTTGTETNTANNTANLNGGASSTAIAVSTVATVENESTIITTPSTVVAPGAVVTYTVTSTNQGGAGATASATVAEKVQLLPGLTTANLKVGTATGTANGSLLQFASTGGTSTYDPATGVLTYYSVTQAPGTTTTYDAIALTVPSAIGNNGQLVATASVSTNLKDNVPGDNVASVGVRVQTLPDVATTITGPSTTPAGLPASYVVKFVNNGTTDAATVTETVQLPAGLTGVSILDASGNAVSGASYNSSTGLVTLPSQSILAAGAEQQYTVALAAAPAQTFPVSSAIASATADGVATNNAANLTTTVTPNADLSVAITGPTVAPVGNLVTYTVAVTNNGPNVANGGVVTLQLPTGLTVLSSGVNGAATVATNTSPGFDTYTFKTFSPIVPGGSAVDYINFTMPNASSGLINGLASVTSSSTDLVASNNTAGITTSISPATTAQADLRTSIGLRTPTGTPASVPAGTSVTYDVAFRNAGDGSGTAGNPALNVMPTATIPAGLSVSTLQLGNVNSTVYGTQSGNIITFNSGYAVGTTYNISTGLLTFPTIASVPVNPASTPNLDYFVTFPAPAGSGQLAVTSEVSSSTSDNFAAFTDANKTATVQSNTNNFSSYGIGITAAYDVATALSGPATGQPGATVGYTVTTLNNGPSTASAATTQNVTGLPSGLTTSTLQVDGLMGTLSGTTITFSRNNATVATYDTGSGTLTLASVAALQPGTASEVVHSFSFPMPSSGNVALTATTASANESNTNTSNNTNTLTTTPANIAPVAQNVWNSLQSPRGNSAVALPISSLNAVDPENKALTYYLQSLPASGTLYDNGKAISSIPTNGYQVSDPSKLSYQPAANMTTVGDVTFFYTATDNGNGTAANALSSPVATYTIMVAQDLPTTYTATTAKGGTSKYATNDVLAYTIDPNTATYNTAGLVYGTGNGTTAAGTSPLLQSGAANGLPTSGTNATVPTAAGSGPAASGNYPANPNNTLPAGVSVDPTTGQVYVSDASMLPRVTALTYYQVNVITTDLKGGTNVTVAQFMLGAYPLPVELVAFTAQAVQNRDALLKWTTASELQNDHFDVERSLDGVSFAKIGQQAGQGNKATSTDYTYTDAGMGLKAAGQPVYYRLRQVDQDGTASYSPVRSVSFTGSVAAVATLYPNPAVAATGLDLSALPATGTYQVLLLDATGRQVYQANLAGGQVQPLSLSTLATGTYSVLVSGSQANGSALHQVLRLTKE